MYFSRVNNYERTNSGRIQVLDNIWFEHLMIVVIAASYSAQGAVNFKLHVFSLNQLQLDSRNSLNNYN